MISFRVLDSSGVRWSIETAYLHGQDDVPVAGEIRVEDGQIVAEPAADGAVGLSLLCDPEPGVEGGVGEVILQTCLLPQRDEPYVLSLELLRHRIMLLLTKLEAWGLFELSADDPTMVGMNRARELFGEALVSQDAILEGTPAGLAATRKAWEALALALRTGEQLTSMQARRELSERFTGDLYTHALAQAQASPLNEGRPAVGVVKTADTLGVVLEEQPTIGCAIRREYSEANQEIVGDVADFISLPMRWVDMEPQEGKYAFGRTDKWIEWAVRTAQIPVHAGPVIDFRPECVPEWLYIWENDYETLREIVYEHLRQLVIRYRRTVSRWTVVSGLHVNRGFKLGYDQMMDLTRLCVLTVRKLHPAAKVQIEITSPWGEYVARSKRAVPPFLYADLLSQMGIAVDALALRLEFGRADRGGLARDLLSFSHLLDRYAELDRPIAITSLGVPAAATSDGAGAWHGSWTERTQAEFFDEAARIALAKPFVHSVCWQALGDEQGVPPVGLVSPDGDVREITSTMSRLRQFIRSKGVEVDA